MSNIQISENESGKYSPEWFYSESQTLEWISFAHKADELRENFINLFGIERLKSLSRKDLLTSLFYNDEGNKSNLCYRLEMDKDIRKVFPAEQHINLDYSIIRKIKVGPVDLH